MLVTNDDKHPKKRLNGLYEPSENGVCNETAQLVTGRLTFELNIRSE